MDWGSVAIGATVGGTLVALLAFTYTWRRDRSSVEVAASIAEIGLRGSPEWTVQLVFTVRKIGMTPLVVTEVGVGWYSDYLWQRWPPRRYRTVTRAISYVPEERLILAFDGEPWEARYSYDGAFKALGRTPDIAFAKSGRQMYRGEVNVDGIDDILDGERPSTPKAARTRRELVIPLNAAHRPEQGDAGEGGPTGS